MSDASDDSATLWVVLGFSEDAVVGAWQDARLAEACAAVWQRAGSPEDVQVLQSAGADDYLTLWFVSPAAAQLFDDHDISWRQFAIGRATPPASAHSVLPSSARSARGR